MTCSREAQMRRDVGRESDCQTIIGEVRSRESGLTSSSTHAKRQRTLCGSRTAHCPGIAEEIQGASETSGVPIEEMTFLGGCVDVAGIRYPTLYPVKGTLPCTNRPRWVQSLRTAPRSHARRTSALGSQLRLPSGDAGAAFVHNAH